MRGYSATIPGGRPRGRRTRPARGRSRSADAWGGSRARRTTRALRPATKAYAVRRPVVRLASLTHASCRPSAASGTRAVIARAIQRDGTRTAGMTSQTSRDGIQTSWPRTETGLGSARRSATTKTPVSPAVADLQLRGQMPPASPRDDEPHEREGERDEPEVVARLGRVRAVLAMLEYPTRPVTEQEVSGRGKEKLEGTNAVHREVRGDTIEAGASSEPRDHREHRRRRGSHRGRRLPWPPTEWPLAGAAT